MYTISKLIGPVDILPVFIFSEFASICITLWTIILLCMKKPQEQTFLRQIKPLLIVILMSSVTEDFSWLASILKLSSLPSLDLRLIILLIRIAWMLSVIQYQSFSLFIERLIPNQSKFLLLLNRTSLFVCACYCAIFMWLILFKTYNLERPRVELCIFENIPLVYMPIMILICLIFTFLALSDRKIPCTLRKILYTFTLGLIGPTMLVDIIQICFPTVLVKYITIAISSLFIALTSYFCIKHMLYLDHGKNRAIENDYP